MNIYVSNLSYDVTEDDLKEAFEAFGSVVSVKIIKDKWTSQSKGFGFVEMPSNSEAVSAIDEMNGKKFKGRNLKVDKAKPQIKRQQGGDGRRRF